MAAVTKDRLRTRVPVSRIGRQGYSIRKAHGSVRKTGSFDRVAPPRARRRRGHGAAARLAACRRNAGTDAAGPGAPVARFKPGRARQLRARDDPRRRPARRAHRATGRGGARALADACARGRASAGIPRRAGRTGVARGRRATRAADRRRDVRGGAARARRAGARRRDDRPAEALGRHAQGGADPGTGRRAQSRREPVRRGARSPHARRADRGGRRPGGGVRRGARRHAGRAARPRAGAPRRAGDDDRARDRRVAARRPAATRGARPPAPGTAFRTCGSTTTCWAGT